MIRRLSAIFLGVALALSSAICRAAPPASLATTQPFEGVTYTHEVRANPPLRLHVVTIDLTRAGTELHVSPAGKDPDGDGPWETTLMKVSAMAQRDGLDIAVNGDFFMTRGGAHDGPGVKMPYLIGEWARVTGFAMTDGQIWSTRAGKSSLVVDKDGKVSIGGFARPPADARQIVSGNTVLVLAGKRVADSLDKAPRTAAGIDAEGRKLVLLVVDGRRPDYSAGLTIGQMADEMIRLGCRWAINLDGGGSSTLVVRDSKSGEWRVVNRPSDGSQVVDAMSVERPVASAFGVRIKSPATQP